MTGQRKRSFSDRSSLVSFTSTIETDAEWQTDELEHAITTDDDNQPMAVVDVLPHEFVKQPKMHDMMIEQLDRFWSHDLFNTREFQDRKDGVCGFIGSSMLFSLDYDQQVNPLSSSELLPEEPGFDRDHYPDDHDNLNFQIRAKIDSFATKTKTELFRLQEIVEGLQGSLDDDVFLYINDDAELILVRRYLSRILLTESGFRGFATVLDDFMGKARRCRRSFKAAKRKSAFQRGTSQLKKMLSIKGVRNCCNY